jgi:hypothetical protein
MILAFLKLDSATPPAGFKGFQTLLTERYASYVHQPLTPFENRHWYLAIKPYHAGIFPFLALDLMSQVRKLPCHLHFAHDVLPYSSTSTGENYLDDTVTQQLHDLADSLQLAEPRMTFKGFGNRIDIGLNALALLYMDILGSLTKVECSVLTLLRTLQFEKYGDPLEVRTFGLQKQVASQLGKSPVAIHKSLKSAKYPLLAETATSMKNMMV